MKKQFVIISFTFFIVTSCSNSSDENYEDISTYPFVEAEFGSSLDLNDLANYANQTVPPYITKNNSQGNAITDKGATLGRVLFYDKNLSSNNNISCASCHHAAAGFQSGLLQGIGEGGIGFGLRGEGRVKSSSYLERDLDVLAKTTTPPTGLSIL